MAGFVYHFAFPDGGEESIDSAPSASSAGELPEWTALDFHQCSNCPLSPTATAHCPMAAQFTKLVSVFGNRLSYDEVSVRVESGERTVTKATTVQRAAGSLMGLLAADSGCPRTDFLKPMAHFHLPLANEEETVYRVASMYLLAQYFVRRGNGTPDFDLEKLKDSYIELQNVNTAMAERLRAVSEKDGTLNGLIVLDLLAKTLQFSIEDALEELQPLFESYVK